MVNFVVFYLATNNFFALGNFLFLNSNIVSLIKEIGPIFVTLSPFHFEEGQNFHL